MNNITSAAGMALAALLLASASSNAGSLTHIVTTQMNNSGDKFGVSVTPGDAKYVTSAALGSTSGPYGDGTLLDWRFETGTNGDNPFQGGTVSSGGGLYFDTPVCNEVLYTPQNWFDVWETSDIDTDPADITSGTIPMIGSSANPLVGNIDISNVLSGQFYMIAGSYSQSATLTVTMTGPGQPDLTDVQVVSPGGSNNRAHSIEWSFDNAGLLYDNIEYEYNGGGSVHRRRYGGVILDGVVPETGGPQITSITEIGGGVWELMLEGEASTGYEFYSSPILDFSPGALVENLAAGGTPVGTIGGPNDSVLTTDGDGKGTARMSLSGSPADFVRAQTAPPAPPVEIFSQNFDGAAGPGLPTGWTSGTNPADNSSLTSWEVGTPANVGPIPPGVPLPSGANCVATNIMGNYDDPASDLGVAHTDIWLRSPAIDLGAATAGTLSFQQWTQIEDVPGDLDYGSIRILDASDDSELAVMEAQSIDGSTSGWEQYSMALPAEAFTATVGTIKVEWRFEADDIDSLAGWYIDDVMVTVPGS